MFVTLLKGRTQSERWTIICTQM